MYHSSPSSNSQNFDDVSVPVTDINFLRAGDDHGIWTTFLTLVTVSNTICPSIGWIRSKGSLEKMCSMDIGLA